TAATSVASNLLIVVSSRGLYWGNGYSYPTSRGTPLLVSVSQKSSPRIVLGSQRFDNGPETRPIPVSLLGRRGGCRGGRVRLVGLGRLLGLLALLLGGFPFSLGFGRLGFRLGRVRRLRRGSGGVGRGSGEGNGSEDRRDQGAQNFAHASFLPRF